MSEITKATAGRFIWVEHTSKDTAAARKFYSELFGWKTEVLAGGYTMFKAGEQIVAGMTRSGVAGWTPYFQVAGCDARVGQAQGAGGKVMAPATETPHVGRWAVVEDPVGA